MSLRCTDQLSQEHRLILRATYVIKTMGDNAKRMRMPDPKDLEDLLSFFRRFADQHHQAKEETILFPALHQASAAQSDRATRHMAFEHEQERSLIRAIGEALHTRNHQEFAYFADQLAEVLGNHIYREDHLLFDVAEGLLTADHDAQLIQEMTALDNTLPAGLYLEWVQTLNRLEMKYLSKDAAS